MLLLLLKGIISKNGLIAGLVAGIVLLFATAYRQHNELAKMRTVYEHPEVKTVEKIVYKEGPSRVRTITIKEAGKETVERIEDRPAIERTTELGTETKVVPVAQAMSELRKDRYLVSVGMNRLTTDFDGKALFVGYGFKNRLDIQVGGMNRDGFSPWVLTTLRF